MIDLEVAANACERTALRLLMAMEDGDLVPRLQELCSDEFVWANSGLPTLRGRDAVVDLMARGGFASELPLLAPMTHFSVDLLAIASRTHADEKAGVVFTERIDHHWAASGSDLMTPRIAGVMEIRDGRVAALRDYYDVACYAQEPTKPDPGFTLEAFREKTRARSAG